MSILVFSFVCVLLEPSPTFLRSDCVSPTLTTHYSLSGVIIPHCPKKISDSLRQFSRCRTQSYAKICRGDAGWKCREKSREIGGCRLMVIRDGNAFCG